jgi:hypothetical protein
METAKRLVAFAPQLRKPGGQPLTREACMLPLVDEFTGFFVEQRGTSASLKDVVTASYRLDLFSFLRLLLWKPG